METTFKTFAALMLAAAIAFTVATAVHTFGRIAADVQAAISQVTR